MSEIQTSWEIKIRELMALNRIKESHFIQDSPVFQSLCRMALASLTPTVSREWRPIEEAPKDGTEILAWSKREALPTLTRWHPVFKQWSVYWQSDAQPTHFMPLPSAPSASIEKGEG